MYALAQTETYHDIGFSLSARRRKTRLQKIELYAADAGIYAQGDRCDAIYKIKFGAVRVYRLLSDGRRQIVAFHLAGDTFGFEAGRTHGFFAETMVESGVTTLEDGAFAKSPTELTMLALREMVRAQEHLIVVGKQCAVEKLAVFLLDLAERQGDPEQIDIPMSRTDIGDYLGMTIETVSRNLSRLRVQGVLRFHSSRSIELVKPDYLRKLCH